MKRFWIAYQPEPPETPVTYWVHVASEDHPYFDAKEFVPPRPKPIPAKGYYLLMVEWNDTTLEFASFEELDHFIDVLSQKNMPTSTRLSEQRPGSKGPNSHWLSRLPSGLKPWEKRKPLVRYLAIAKESFSKELQIH